MAHALPGYDDGDPKPETAMDRVRALEVAGFSLQSMSSGNDAPRGRGEGGGVQGRGPGSGGGRPAELPRKRSSVTLAVIKKHGNNI